MSQASQLTEAILKPQREAEKFGRGAKVADTLGHDIVALSNNTNPIKKIVVIMQENRSFDHYFGKINEYRHARLKKESDPRGSKPIPRWDPVESLKDNTWADVPEIDPITRKYPTNPRNVGQPDADKVEWQHAPHYSVSDLNHSWAGAHLQYNSGKMDGFVHASHYFYSKGEPKISDEDEPELLDGARAMYYYDDTDLPFYYELADTFSLADRYFCSVLGPTYINRDFLYAGTSFGLTYCDMPNLHNVPTPVVITDSLMKAGHDFRIYIKADHWMEKFAARIAVTLAHNPLELANRDILPSLKVRNYDQFLSDAHDGELGYVSFIDADIREDADGNDEHAPSDVQKGQKFVYDIIKAIIDGDDWERTVIIFTYDEHGGFYDHVPPPSAVVPDALSEDGKLLYDDGPKGARANQADNKFSGGFDRLGFRVPMMVISPWSKPNYISHVTYDHTSILRFIEWVFDLPALTRRDANATPPFDMLDLTKMSFPADVARKLFPDPPPINPEEVAWSDRKFPTAGVLAKDVIPSRLAANPYPDDSDPQLQVNGASKPTLK